MEAGPIDVVVDGEDFGWTAVVGSNVRNPAARTTEPSVVLAIDGRRLLALFDGDPQMGYVIMSRLLQTVSDRSMQTPHTLGARPIEAKALCLWCP